MTVSPNAAEPQRLPTTVTAAIGVMARRGRSPWCGLAQDAVRPTVGGMPEFYVLLRHAATDAERTALRAIDCTIRTDQFRALRRAVDPC